MVCILWIQKSNNSSTKADKNIPPKENYRLIYLRNRCKDHQQNTIRTNPTSQQKDQTSCFTIFQLNWNKVISNTIWSFRTSVFKYQLWNGKLMQSCLSSTFFCVNYWAFYQLTKKKNLYRAREIVQQESWLLCTWPMQFQYPASHMVSWALLGVFPDHSVMSKSWASSEFWPQNKTKKERFIPATYKYIRE